MTGEELTICFLKHDKEFLNFDRIPEADRLHPRPDVAAMLYLHNKLTPDAVGDNAISAAEHDQIWFTFNVSGLDESDVIYLLRCGVSYDSEAPGLYMFK